MKRIILIFAMTLVLVFGALPLLDTPVSAATSGYTGSCTWSLNDTILTISGNGPMADYDDENLPPWIESAPYISTIHVKEGVPPIGDYAFVYCAAVNVMLPNYSLTRIGNGAFLMCGNITSFWMPHTITDLGISVFSGCYRLQYLAISTENPVYTSAGNCIIEKSGGTVVAGCAASTIPQESWVTTIGAGAFMLHYSNASLVVPGNITSIGEGAFYGLQSHVNLSEGLKSIGSDAFAESSLRFMNLPSSLEEIGAGAFIYCYDLTSLTIPEGVKFIGADAFFGCNLQNTVTIPSTVYFIGESAFSANPNLSGINVAEGNSRYKGINGCLIETSSGTLITGCSNSVIPEGEGITRIGNYAFSYLKIQSVVLPSGVTSVGTGAFCGCESLKYVYLPAGVTYVEAYAFCDIPYIEGLSLQKTSPNFHQTSFENTRVINVWVEGTPHEVGSVTVSLLSGSNWHYVDNYCAKKCDHCGNGRPDPNAGHRYTNTCDPDCDRCGEKRNASHSYYNACDKNCNKCGEIRSVPDHVYSSDCDELCDECNSRRSAEALAEHVYSSPCDTICDTCGTERPAAEAHSYLYACSTKCTLCGESRDAYHKTTLITPANKIINDPVYPFIQDEDGWYVSTNKEHNTTASFTIKSTHHCGSFSVVYKVSSEAGGDIFTIPFPIPTIASGETGELGRSGVLYQDKTLTITYAKNGSISAGEDCVRFKIFCRCEESRCFASTSITPNCSTGDIICDSCHEIIKDGPDHSFTNSCSTECNNCTFVRSAPHSYDNDCDAECNECGETRSANHLYSNACDEVCNRCNAQRKAPHVYDHANDLICNECGCERPPYTPGDLDGAEGVSMNDAIYLLYHLNFSALYPVDQPVDFDGNGKVDLNDAIYLLYHINFSTLYPLH